MKRNRLVFVVTEDWYFCSHRLVLARAAEAQGYEVHVITQLGKARQQLEKENFTVHPVKVRRASLNPLREVVLFLTIARLLFKIKPDLIHNVSLKPVLYSSVAAKMVCKGRIINALTGLGFVYSSTSIRARLLRPITQLLLWVALAGNRAITIFQNEDDLELLVDARIVRRSRSVLIRGSGVNTENFRPQPAFRRVVVVALPARLLREKGVYEFVAAANILKSQGVSARFALIGEGDTSNRGSVTPGDLARWRQEEVVELWGWSVDMAATLREVDIVVLPSYRGEGVPKTLLEAASCGLPLITTETPGCRDIVHQGVNGYLVPMRSTVPLAEAIARLVSSESLRRQMGQSGRQRVVEHFSETIVVSSTLCLYEHVLNRADS